jgi:hypothetical protein
MPAEVVLMPRYIARHPMTASRELGGEMIVIFARDSRLFTLNEAGASIWKAANGATPIEAIAREVLCAGYEVDEPTASADLRQFVADLVEQGILVASDEPIPGAEEPGRP